LRLFRISDPVQNLSHHRHCGDEKEKYPSDIRREQFEEMAPLLERLPDITQVGFATEAGITQRTVAYYEVPDAQPPVHLLPQMAAALGVSADHLAFLSVLLRRF
jgi:hypothetical protein